jgi:hypothetical protein
MLGQFDPTSPAGTDVGMTHSLSQSRCYPRPGQSSRFPPPMVSHLGGVLLPSGRCRTSWCCGRGYAHCAGGRAEANTSR